MITLMVKSGHEKMLLFIDANSLDKEEFEKIYKSLKEIRSE